MLVLVTNRRDDGCTYKDGYSYRDADNIRIPSDQNEREKSVHFTINRVKNSLNILNPSCNIIQNNRVFTL